MPSFITLSSPSRTSASVNLVDVAAVLLVVGFGCLSFLTTATLERYGSDTSTYFGLARSLLHDGTYSFDFEPHVVYPPGLPVLLAALMAFLGDSFSVLEKALVPVYSISLLLIYYLVRIHRSPQIALVTVGLMATSYVFHYFATTGLYSEGPYLLASVLALLLFDVAIRTEKRWIRVGSLLMVSALTAYVLLVRSIGIALAIALILWMLDPVRLVAGGFARFPFARMKVVLPVLVIPALALIGWATWGSQHKPAEHARDYMSSYSSQLLKKDPHQIDSPNMSVADLPSRLLSMADIRMQNAARMIFNLPSRTFTWLNPMLLLLLVVLVAGFVRALTIEGRLLDYYVLSYAGVLLTWPFDEGMRFLFPVQAFLILYAIDGLPLLFRILRSTTLLKMYLPLSLACAAAIVITAFAVHAKARISGNEVITLVSAAGFGCYLLYLRYVNGNRPASHDQAVARNVSVHRSVTAAVFVGICGLGLYQQQATAIQNLRPDPEAFVHAPSTTVARWVAENTDRNEVVMIDEYEIVHRLSGRKTIRFPLSTDPREITARIMEKNVGLVVVFDEKQYEYYNPSSIRRFEAVRSLHPGMFVQVHELDGGKIYRVNKKGLASQ